MNCPRILVAAPKSGSGKTLITCALLKALKEQGHRPVSFKCGPDYIDPMFHRRVLGIPSENLDTWFAGEEGVREILAESMKRYGMGEKAMPQSSNPASDENSGDSLAVLEGVMGLYDGVGGTGEEGSAYHLAKVTGTPILLVMDVHGMGRTMLPLLAGILAYDTEKLIKGIVLNRTSAGFFATMKPLLEQELPVPVLGYFPNRKDLHFSSRHLGLQLPEEISDLQEQLTLAAKLLQENIDLKRLLTIAEAVEDLPEMTAGGQTDAAGQADVGGQNDSTELTLAVARDEAFCFYYPANLREFEKRGVKVREFSPLHDRELPQGVDGLLLGGGYPELYGPQLAANESMRSSIREALADGLPSLAECGGFMYLHESLTDEAGGSWPMCGVIDGKVSWQGKLIRFGYAELSEKDPCFLPEEASVKAHEFHYYDSSDNGAAWRAKKPLKTVSWDCMHAGADHLWGFPHLYYPSAPQLVDRFVESMRQRHRMRQAAEQKKQ